MLRGGRIKRIPMRRKTRLRRHLKPIRAKKGKVTVKALDKLFSLFVRLSGADKEGLVRCYTCPYVAHWKKIHAGHYISRWYKRTRWDENNVRPQCFSCNIWRKGNAVVFRHNLVDELGRELVEQMEKTAREMQKGFGSSATIVPLIEKYKEKLSHLTQ